MTDTNWLEIDLLALQDNVRLWRRMVTPRSGRGASSSHAGALAGSHAAPKICAVIKADGYGLGAGELARCYQSAGVDMLAVYSPAQADELLRHPIDRPILLLMPVRTRPETPRLLNALLHSQLHFTVDCFEQLLAINAFGLSYGCRIPVHLSLDTGMSRGGLTHSQLTMLLRRLPRLRHVQLAGIWTHFAAADCDDEFTRQQLDRFTAAIEVNRKRIRRDVVLHAAASHAALLHRRYHLGMIRLGVGLLGYVPDLAGLRRLRRRNEAGQHGGHHANNESNEPPQVADDDGGLDLADQLQPAVRWCSRIVHVRRFPKGSTVGYGCEARLQRDSTLAIVPVGYADGYPLTLSGKGVVRILRRGELDDDAPLLAPVIGRVNMDQIVIDLTAARELPRETGAHAAPAIHIVASASTWPPPTTAPAASPAPCLGQTVELISPQSHLPCSLTNLAALAGSTCYEMLCRISTRVPRIYSGAAPQPMLLTSERLKVSAV